MSGADEDGVAVKFGCVVGVGGLRQLRHDQVADVDDVVDGIQADAFEARLQPERRGADSDVFKDESAEARAKGVVGDPHFGGRRAAGQNSPNLAFITDSSVT